MLNWIMELGLNQVVFVFKLIPGPSQMLLEKGDSRLSSRAKLYYRFMLNSK
jgi:hypothetical protein